jgi:hypothetical protein
MAVASLMKDETYELQELFTSRLDALGISKMKDLAFLLGNESDAERTSKEIFGAKHCSEVQSALQSAKSPGKAALFWEVKLTSPPAVVPHVVPEVPAFILPLRVKDDVGLLLVKTTVAVLTTKRAISSSSSSSSCTSSKSLKEDMAAEWRKVLILCMQFLKCTGYFYLVSRNFIGSLAPRNLKFLISRCRTTLFGLDLPPHRQYWVI